MRQVPYESRLYQPLLGEPALRLKLRRFRGVVTVPVLTTDDGRVIGDSIDIARWADERGEGPRLFPPEHEREIVRFVALSEQGLAAGRALSLERMLRDDEALADMVPRGLRRRLGRLAPRLGELGIRRTFRKYDGQATALEGHRVTLRGALDEVRRTLRAQGRGPGDGEAQTLLGRFTFADMAVAQIAAYLEPPSAGLKLRPSSRRTFADPALCAEYPDVVAWRDALYAAYRGRTP